VGGNGFAWAAGPNVSIRGAIRSGDRRITNTPNRDIDEIYVGGAGSSGGRQLLRPCRAQQRHPPPVSCPEALINATVTNATFSNLKDGGGRKLEPRVPGGHFPCGLNLVLLFTLFTGEIACHLLISFPLSCSLSKGHGNARIIIRSNFRIDLDDGCDAQRKPETNFDQQM